MTRPSPKPPREVNRLWTSDNGQWAIYLNYLSFRGTRFEESEYLGMVSISGPDYDGHALLRGDGSIEYSNLDQYGETEVPKYVQTQVSRFFNGNYAWWRHYAETMSEILKPEPETREPRKSKGSLFRFRRSRGRKEDSEVMG